MRDVINRCHGSFATPDCPFVLRATPGLLHATSILSTGFVRRIFPSKSSVVACPGTASAFSWALPYPMLLATSPNPGRPRTKTLLPLERAATACRLLPCNRFFTPPGGPPLVFDNGGWAIVQLADKITKEPLRRQRKAKSAGALMDQIATLPFLFSIGIAGTLANGPNCRLLRASPQRVTLSIMQWCKTATLRSRSGAWPVRQKGRRQSLSLKRRRPRCSARR